jgi:hypothetical protein
MQFSASIPRIAGSLYIEPFIGGVTPKRLFELCLQGWNTNPSRLYFQPLVSGSGFRKRRFDIRRGGNSEKTLLIINRMDLFRWSRIKEIAKV